MVRLLYNIKGDAVVSYALRIFTDKTQDAASIVRATLFAFYRQHTDSIFFLNYKLLRI
jgi:hypothetical protein